MNPFNPMVGINKSNFSSISGFNDIDTVTESSDESYLSQNFSFLTQINNEYTELNKHFYKSVLESNGNVVGVQEAYSDFFTGFKNIIDKFLAFVKNVFNKFVTRINSFVQNEKYLIKSEKEFEKFTDKDNFSTGGYNYSFDPFIPIINLTIKFDSVLMGDINKIKNLPTEFNSGIKSEDKAKAAINRLHDDLRYKLENDYYDLFRATVIGSTGVISEDDFEEECFKVYRSGQSKPENLLITRGYIDEALERIKNYKKVLKDVEDLKSKIEKEYTAIRDKVEKMIKPNSTQISEKLRTIEMIGFDTSNSVTDMTVSYDTLTALDSYLKTISTQVQEMSNIHSTAFVSKIEAIKEQFVQDKRILYTALGKCQTGAKKIYNIDESYNSDDIERVGRLWIM